MAEPKRSITGLIVKGVFALAISVLTLWWAFHDVPLDNVMSQLGNTTVGVLALYVLAQIVMHGIRILRFGLLVQPLGTASPRAIFAAVSVGIPATFFFPLRLGEFVRPVMLARSGVPFGAGMAAVAVERIADGLFNVGLFFFLLTTFPGDVIPDQAQALAYIALIGFGGGMLFLMVAYFVREPVLSLLRRLLSPLSAKIADKVIGLTETFLDGLAALKTLPRFGIFVITTAAFWMLNGAATWMLAESYVNGLDFWAGQFAISATVFTVMVPAGPAFAGTMEAGFRIGLMPYQVGAEAAAVVAICAHAFHLLLMSAFGGVGLLAAEPGTVFKAREES